MIKSGWWLSKTITASFPITQLRSKHVLRTVYLVHAYTLPVIYIFFVLKKILFTQNGASYHFLEFSLCPKKDKQNIYFLFSTQLPPTRSMFDIGNNYYLLYLNTNIT